jgi:hypothetical protein
MDAPVTRLSWSDVFSILESWKSLIRIELRSGIYDGKIAGLSQETGEMQVLTAAEGKGRKTMKFSLRDADFERFKDPGEWADVFVAFPTAGAWFILRKWK